MEGKSLPPSLPACWTLICHLSWVICGALGVFRCSCGLSPPKHLACQKTGSIKELWIASPARGEQGDESLAAWLEPCSSFDADGRVSFIRVMSCNSNNSGTLLFAPQHWKTRDSEEYEAEGKSEEQHLCGLLLFAALEMNRRSAFSRPQASWVC